MTDVTAENKCNSSDVVDFYNAAARSDISKSLDQRCEARIVYMRNFNNWLKSVLISTSLDELRSSNRHGENSRIRVLDLCCGKGGDQQKWLIGQVSHVTFVDISSDSIEVCKQRYNQLSRRNMRIYSANFMVWDYTKEFPADLKTFGPFHLVSCQFALHYAFESLPQTRTMLTNVAECLHPDGLFIATFPNAYELVRRANLALHSTPQPTASPRSEDCPAEVGTLAGGGIRFGNPVYSIAFPPSSYTLTPALPADGDTKPETTPALRFPLFGARYNFRLEGVVDCPEFLVYPPLLVYLAQECGLAPTQEPGRTTTSFPDFCHRQLLAGQHSSSGQHRDLLARMNALEGIRNPRHEDDDDEEGPGSLGGTKFDKEAYRHVEKRLEVDEFCRQSRFLGTLSTLEWEVISLYSVISLRRSV